MPVSITNPSSKYIIVTPSANVLTYGGDSTESFTAGILKDGTAGDVTCVNDNGDAIVVPFAANQFLPFVTNKITVVSAGTALALFQNN